MLINFQKSKFIETESSEAAEDKVNFQELV